MRHETKIHRRRARGATNLAGLALTLGSAAGAVLGASWFAGEARGAASAPSSASGGEGQDPAEGRAALEETRLALEKWIETQQVISKESLEWQQGREILAGRIELLKQETTLLETRIDESRAALAAGEAKRAALAQKDEELARQQARLAEAAGGLEYRVKFLLGALPGPVREKVAPLAGRIPEKPEETRISVAERFQNVLGILNEVDKSNSEISVAYEVRTLSDGKRSEVKALYVGLSGAYYVSATGEAGIGRPASDGWTWESANGIAGDVLRALEILQGKHSPAFVPLPARIQ